MKVQLIGPNCKFLLNFQSCMDTKGKSDWQTVAGQSNYNSNSGMIIDIILGMIALLIAIFGHVSFLG